VNFLSESFIKRHVEKCKQIMRRQGYLAPFILISKSDESPTYLPIPEISEDFRPHFWINLAVREFEPETLVFTGIAWAKEVPKGQQEEFKKEYKYGDLQKKGKEVIMIILADLKRRINKAYLVPIVKTERGIRFGKMEENGNSGGMITHTIRRLMERNKYIV